MDKDLQTLIRQYNTKIPETKWKELFAHCGENKVAYSVVECCLIIVESYERNLDRYRSPQEIVSRYWFTVGAYKVTEALEFLGWPKYEEEQPNDFQEDLEERFQKKLWWRVTHYLEHGSFEKKPIKDWTPVGIRLTDSDKFDRLMAKARISKRRWMPKWHTKLVEKRAYSDQNVFYKHEVLVD